MRRLALALGGFILLFISISPPVSAHVLKADGDIGVILHINPDDSPISGKPTSYVLYFDDTSGRFNLHDCGCRTKISLGSQTVNDSALRVVSSLTSENTVVFPKPGVYTLTVSGTPKHISGFQPFTVSYIVRVGGVDNQQFPVLLWVGIGLAIGLILLAAFAMERDS